MNHPIHHHQTRRSPSRQGLTLLEMVVVIAILAMLAGIVLPMLDGNVGNSKAIATQSSLTQLQDAIVNRYAPNVAGIVDNGGAFPQDGLPRPDSVYFQAGRNTTVPQLQFLFVCPNETAPANDPSQARWIFNPQSDSMSKLAWRGPYLTLGRGSYPSAAGDATLVTRGFFGSSGTAIYGLAGDATVLDAWGNPIVIRKYVSGGYANHLATTTPDSSVTLNRLSSVGTIPVLVSAGPDGDLNTDSDNETLRLR